jgi:hypothetical protein
MASALQGCGLPIHPVKSRVLLIASCFLVIVPFTTARAAAPSIYIAVRTDGAAGAGTQADPFDGSTEEKFDALMAGFPVSTQIHLGAGTFLTYGYDAFSLKAGWVVQGQGMGVTILKLMARPTENSIRKHYHLAGLSCANVQISDLTCDGNYQGCNWPAHDVVGGVSPYGSNVVIDSVEIINCYGDQADGLEEFSILLGGMGPQNIASNCVIKNCRTHQYAPGANYTNGPMISYCSGAQIVNCTDDGSNHGFGFAGDTNAELQGCTSSPQTATAFYTDTSSDSGITIEENSLSSSQIPIQFNSGRAADQVTIPNNALASTNSTGWGSAAIVLSGAGGDDFVITGNVFTHTGPGGSGFILNNERLFTGLDVEDNSSNEGLAGAGGSTTNITACATVVQGNQFDEPVADLAPPTGSPGAEASPETASDDPSSTGSPATPSNSAGNGSQASSPPAANPAPAAPSTPAAPSSPPSSPSQTADAPSSTPTAPANSTPAVPGSTEDLANQVQSDTNALVQQQQPVPAAPAVSHAATPVTNVAAYSQGSAPAAVNVAHPAAVRIASAGRRGIPATPGREMSGDPTSNGGWILKLPTGGLRDAALRSYSTRLVKAEPGEALQWADMISDEQIQQAQVTSVLQKWMQRDAASASVAVQNSSLPEDLKARLLGLPE